MKAESILGSGPYALGKTPNQRHTVQMQKIIYAISTLFLLAAISVNSHWAHAQDEESITNLMHFAANNEEFDDLITAKAKDLFKHQIKDCTGETKQIVRQLPTAYSDFIFKKRKDNDKFPPPVSGIWIEHVKIRACARVYQINILAAARYGLSPALLGILPGTTLSDPSAQRDAERVGALTIKKFDSTCAANASAKNTRMLGFLQADNALGNKDASKGWFEEWQFDFCQKTIPVQMAFLPNESGGYDIRARIANAQSNQ